MNKFEFIKNTWGWEPHKTQREFMEYDSKIKIAACGRRWGKSEACAYDMAYYFLARENFSQMIVSPTYDQSKLIFRVVENLLNYKGIEIKRSPYPYIKYKNNLITARTADNDGMGLRGNKADRIILDEAAYIKDRVVYEVISPMLADTNGDLVMISTPFGKNHFYDFFQKGEKRDKECASFTYKSTDNPHISREYIEKQRENISEMSFATEYEAQFCDNISNVFKKDSVMNAVNLNRDVMGDIIVGVDFARYSDWTVAVVLRCDGEKAQMIDMVRFNRVTWAEEIERILKVVEKYRPVKMICDATGVGDPVCESLGDRLLKENLETELVRFKFSNESKNMIMDNLNVLFDKGNLGILDNEILIKELLNYEYTLSESGFIKMAARYNFHDDTVCALALACSGIKDTGSRGLICAW